MGWQLIAAADLPAVPNSGGDSGVLSALIYALTTVLVAVLAYAGTRGGRTTASPPVSDPHLGERVAVSEAHDRTTDRTLAQLDRHVDAVSDLADRTSWRLEQLEPRVTGLEQQLGAIRQAWQDPPP